MNGEIWNILDISRSLNNVGDHASEYEVIRAAYAQIGPRFVRHLNGMFVIAILDATHNKLFLYRDPVGIKPLYYWTNLEAGAFIFASDPRPILRLSGCNLDLNANFLINRSVLGFSDYADNPYRAIHQLPPSHYVELDLQASGDSAYVIHEYSTSGLVVSPSDTSDRSVLDILARSVERCLTHGDSEQMGLLLSGGIDSSIIAYLARDLGYRDLMCFYMGSEDSEDHYWAQRVAADTGLNLEIIKPHKLKTIELLPRAASQTGGYRALATFILFHEIHRRHPQIKVVLCGEGADELHAGYHWNRDPIKRWRTIAERVQAAPETTPLTARAQRIYDHIRSLPPHAQVRVAIEESLNIDRHEQLVDNHLNPLDLSAMASSIEVRVPYLDLEHVRFSRELPVDAKINKGVTKPLLRRLLQGLSMIEDSNFYSRNKSALPRAIGPILPSIPILGGQLLRQWAEYLGPFAQYCSDPFDAAWYGLVRRAGMRTTR